MNDLLQTIREKMITDSDDYQLMAEYRVNLSSLYSTLSEKSKEYVIAKADFQNALKRQMILNKEKVVISTLDREWEMSPQGVQAELLAIDMKGVNIMISSLTQLIRVVNSDFFNSKHQ